MKTAEEILKKHNCTRHDPELNIDNLILMMEEYANQFKKDVSMDEKDKRIKELEKCSLTLFEMVHDSDLIENKIAANELYTTIIKPKG